MVTYFKNSIYYYSRCIGSAFDNQLHGWFALSKIKFRENKKILEISCSGLILPFRVALIPLFTILIIWASEYLSGSYSASVTFLYLIPFSQIFYSFMQFASDEIIEAAIIDGCTPFRTFIRIVIPMSTNSLLTVATMQGIHLGDLHQCIYFAKSTTMKTVTLGLNDLWDSWEQLIGALLLPRLL